MEKASADRGNQYGKIRSAELAKSKSDQLAELGVIENPACISKRDSHSNRKRVIQKKANLSHTFIINAGCCYVNQQTTIRFI